MGLQWVTGRTKCRKERRETVRQSEQGTESRKADLSLSDGCIQNRNNLIRQQLEMDEVRRLFGLGKRLGIQCQNNEEEVISRLAALEGRDEANFRRT
ncbi:hypothetical protein SLE2022_397070 [Rubroshorea leprosula]